MLEAYISARAQERGILLMAHIVLGYPSYEASVELVDTMVRAGVDLIELQIPFSEPIADGPVILRANQAALEAGATVERCLACTEELVKRHDVPFVFMTYYNILYRAGLSRFVQRMREAGVKGAIVPDLPPEEADEYLALMRKNQLDPIFIFSPRTQDARLGSIAEHARGFVYVVARRGVTGANTDFSSSLEGYLARCRAATSLPLALGFGVKSKADIDFLRGKVEVAVVGSETLRVFDESGVLGVESFLRGLRA